MRSSGNHVNTLMAMAAVFVIVMAFLGCGRDRPVTHTVERADSLYPVAEGAYIGYVDASGTMKIQPRFRSAGLFMNGRAPAREHGLYGYIGTTGEWIVQPRYEYATDFAEGMAAVFMHGQAAVIDTLGHMLFRVDADAVGPFTHGFAAFRKNKSYGLVTAEGRILAFDARSFHVLNDSMVLMNEELPGKQASRTWKLLDRYGTCVRIYNGYDKAIVTFGSPKFLLESENSSPDRPGSTTYKTVLCSSDGATLIPLSDGVGEINAINPCGYVTVTSPRMYQIESTSVVLDPKGKVTLDAKGDRLWIEQLGAELFLVSRQIHHGIEVVRLNNHGVNRVIARADDVQHHELMAQGQALPHDVPSLTTTRHCAVLFDHGRARVMDDAGRMSKELRIDHDDGVVHVDTSHVIIQHWSNSHESSSLLFYVSNGGLEPIARIDSVEQIEALDHGALTVRTHHAIVLVNLRGNVLWKGKESALYPPTMGEFDYKPEVARAFPTNEAWPLRMLDRRAASAMRIQQSASATSNVCAMVVRRSPTDTSRLDVIIANTSTHEVPIIIHKEYALLVMEARRSEHDQWFEIEHQLRSWCALCAGIDAMPARSFWRVSVPRYHGTDTVECRMKFTRLDGTASWYRKDLQSTPPTYSNTFTMTILPGQQWRIARGRSGESHATMW